MSRFGFAGSRPGASHVLGLSLGLTITIAATSSHCAAQERDSLRHYDLDEIVVRSQVERSDAATIQRIPINDAARLASPTADGIIGLVPAARVQTNSRGEALVYVRNAGERQVATFFAGALLNVPWDNRVDLSTVPSVAVGAIEVAKGPSSILYGTNVVGGAVNLIPRSLDYAGRVSDMSVTFGSERARRIAASTFARSRQWQFGAALEHTASDGQSLPSEASTPFSQADDDIRTNTDHRFTGVYANAARDLGDAGTIGLTLIHNEGDKGIAPEAHIDPASGGVRFWRYPDLSRSYAILNYASTGARGRISATAWASRFSQRIDQFADDEYASLVERQDDDDGVVGGRVAFDATLTRTANVLLAANYLSSIHDQSNTTVATDEAATESYRQDIYNIGAEYRQRLYGSTLIKGGLALDGYLAPDATGDARKSAQSVTASVGGSHTLAPGLRARIAAGRKVRFPTTRELLDTGLGRFLLNPELGPESTLLAEAAVEITRQDWAVELIPFASRTSDTIDQTRVTIDDVVYRQRTNLESSSVVGIETIAVASPTRGLTIDLDATLTRVRARQDGESTHLTERPAAFGSLSVTSRAPSGLAARIGVHHTGRAWGLAESGALVKLPVATTLDVRISHLFTPRSGGFVAETFVHVDNVFDTLTVPQLGLPGSGRTIRAGLSVSV